MFGEHALAEAARGRTEPIRTDPATASSARWLLETAGAADRVTAGPPRPGELYFLNAAPRRRFPAGWTVREAPAGSTVAAHYSQQRGLVAGVMAAAGLDRVLPPVLWRKLSPPPHQADLLRIQ